MKPSLDTIVTYACLLTSRADGLSFEERIAEFERIFGQITPKN